MRARSHRLSLTMGMALVLALASLLAAMGEARADEAASVACDACHVEAYLMPDGNLSVVERWTVTFVGACHGIEWTIDTAHSDATNVAVTGAGEVVAGDLVAYDYAPGESHALGTYSTKGDFRRRTCTLYFDKADETVELYVACRLRGAAERWRDAAVLDWRFLDTAEGFGVDDVTVDLFLERPAEGGVWPGENVFAWSTVGRPRARRATSRTSSWTRGPSRAWPRARTPPASGWTAARSRVATSRKSTSSFRRAGSRMRAGGPSPSAARPSTTWASGCARRRSARMERRVRRALAALWASSAPVSSRLPGLVTGSTGKGRQTVRETLRRAAWRA